MKKTNLYIQKLLKKAQIQSMSKDIEKKEGKLEEKLKEKLLSYLE